MFRKAYRSCRWRSRTRELPGYPALPYSYFPYPFRTRQPDTRHCDTAVAVGLVVELNRIGCTEQLESEQLEPVHRLGGSAREGR